MRFSNIIDAAKIAIHWDHILAPSDPNSGKNIEDSWKGTAKRVAGLVLFVISSGLIGLKSSFLLFTISGSYHLYHAYQKAQIKSEESPLPIGLSDEEVNRRNQLGIEAIMKAIQAGKQIGLVIGRDKDQPMPQEEGWLWVAGNIEGDPEVLANRVDLKMDFGELENIEKISGLFDKVVVDISTLKFFSNSPWESFRSLLKPLPTSQLITETSKGGFGIDTHTNKVVVDCQRGSISYPMKNIQRERDEGEKLFKEWESQFSETERKSKKQAFIDAMDAETREQLLKFGGVSQLDICYKQHILEALFPNRYMASDEAERIGVEHFRHYLKTLFNRVELYHDAPYPTREGLSHWTKGDYFVLTDPMVKPTRERIRTFQTKTACFY